MKLFSHIATKKFHNGGDGTQAADNLLTVAAQDTVGIEVGVRVCGRHRRGGEVGGDDKQLAGTLGIVTQLKERVVNIAVVLARLLAQVIDDNDALALQILYTAV